MTLLAYLALLGAVLLGAHVCAALCAWAVFARPPRLLVPLLDRLDARRHPPSDPMPPVLHQLELARLAEELRRVRESRQPGLATRVRACTAAYDYVLVACARDLGLPAPDTMPPLSAGERFEVETRLMAEGMQW